MKKAILLDLDGTLWDSSRQVVDAFNRAMARHPELNRQITVEELSGYMGLNRVDLRDRLFPMAPPERREELIAECFAEELSYLRECPGVPYPGLRQTLEGLSREYTLAIVSNCQAGYVEVFLETMDLGRYIADHECFATGLSKGENIQLVMERDCIDRAIYVGDTQGDLNAADRAGLPFVHAAYGFGAVDRETARIGSLEELPGVAAELLK